MKTESKNLIIPRKLWIEAQATVTPRQKPKEIKYGALKNSKSNIFRKYSDEMLLEMRWLKDFGGWKRGEIARFYGIEPDKLTKILDYSTCGDVVPYPDSFPENHHPKNNARQA